ncbi:UDP-3-O-[3-hydroxymyristoyl] glucosamine N-acyltransferase [hydrothermal vent metagenome]|uniref:UDP-3-O-[3-hydroxymyristoyl] glucosamine N-acyltransferase n=1 Tax=hydrothermal vent metagenome TaxID=652676 RepID=A0A3B0T9D2_9ZZZZ
MARGTFFENKGPFTLAEIAKLIGAEIAGDADPDMALADVASIAGAGAGEITFFHDRRYLGALKTTAAGAVVLAENMRQHVPQSVAVLVTNMPELAFARIIGAFYPSAVRPGTGLGGVDFTGGQVHPSARVEDGVVLSPGALIGPGAQIGAGTEIGPNAVIGAKVSIGRDCLIGPNVNLVHAMVGDRVFIHAGASIGQDGFGYSLGPGGLYKVPQIGRVIIQNDVEIGANTAIDRGALEDTVIGQGTKIDNLVQIAHAVKIGQHCGIVSQTGISGSVTIEDQVFMGGQSGVIPHKTVGTGVHVAAGTGITKNVDPGERIGGRPHRPLHQHMREWALIAWLIRPENRPRSKKDVEN